MAEAKKHPDCLTTPGVKCKLRPILPARYALTSESKPPLESSAISGKNDLVKLNNYHYTLRTIQTGYVFIIWDGLSDKDILVYQAERSRFREVSGHGYGNCPHCVKIPDDPEITEIYIAYVRLPDLCAKSAEEQEEPEDKWQAVDRNSLEKEPGTTSTKKQTNAQQPAAEEQSDSSTPLWKLTAENLLKENKKRMQRVTLRAAPYSAPRGEIFKLVEEFRPQKETQRLHYLRTWPKSRIFLRSYPDTAIPEECWEASVDQGYHVHESVYDLYLPEDTVLVALHDSIGQVYDCASIYSKSFAGMRNYERFHSHMHTSGFLSQGALESWAKSLADKAKANQKDLVLRYNLDPRLIATADQAQPSTGETGAYRFLPFTPPRPHDALASDLDEIDEALRDVAENQVRSLNRYNPKADYRYQALFKQQDIVKFEPYRQQCQKAMEAFAQESQLALVDWFALLGADNSKQYSFGWTLREIFDSPDQHEADSTETAKPLTHARDAVFTDAHFHISLYAIAGDAGKDGHCAHYDLIHEKLINASAYMDLYGHVTRTGGEPHERYAALMQHLGGFIVYCNKSAAKRATVDKLLSTMGARFGIEKIEREQKGQSSLVDALLLTGLIDKVDAKTLAAAYGYGDFAKSSSDAAGFFNIFADQYLLNCEPHAQELKAALADIKAELGQLGKEPAHSRDPHKIARRRLSSKFARLRNKLLPYQRSLLESEQAIVLNSKGRPWTNRPGKQVGQSSDTIGDIEEDSSSGKNPNEVRARYRTAAKLTGSLISILAVCNTVYFANDALKKMEQGKADDALVSTMHMVPHALTSAQIVFTALGKEALVKSLARPVLVFGSISDIYTTADLALHRDFDAAAGSGIMAASGLALSYVAWTSGTLGLASLGTPVTAALFLLFLTGFAVYAFCKDSDVERYLKNGLWSKTTDAVRSRNEIINGRVDCLKPCAENAFWQKQRSEVEEYIQLFFPVSIILYCNQTHAYLGIAMPHAGKSRKILDVRLRSGPQHVTLSPADVAAGPVENTADGLHWFEVCFDLGLLRKKIPPLEFQYQGMVAACDLSAYLEVVLTYFYSEDITYSTVNASIALDDTSDHPVGKNRLKALLKTLYGA